MAGQLGPRQPKNMKLDAGIIGAGLGGGIGAWLFENNLYAGLCAGAGFLAGSLIGWLYNRWRLRHKKNLQGN
jgi:hypothetical protein